MKKDEVNLKKIKDLDYFKLLDFLKNEKKLKINFEDKTLNNELNNYFDSEFNQDFRFLYKNKIFNSRINEEDFITILINLTNHYSLKEEKTKEELIELLKNEKIDCLFSISFILMLHMMIGNHVSVYKKNYQTGERFYSNYFEQNLGKLISLYMTGGENENLPLKDVLKQYSNKILYPSEMVKWHLIRDLSALRHTIYFNFITMKKI